MRPELPCSDRSSEQATLSVRIDHDNDTAILRMIVSGEVDSVSCAELRQTFTHAVGRHRPAVVDMDVGGVTFLDSTGIRTLIECQAEAGRSDGILVLSRAPRIVHRVLEISGLLEHFGLPAEQPA